MDFEENKYDPTPAQTPEEPQAQPPVFEAPQPPILETPQPPVPEAPAEQPPVPETPAEQPLVPQAPVIGDLRVPERPVIDRTPVSEPRTPAPAQPVFAEEDAQPPDAAEGVPEQQTAPTSAAEQTAPAEAALYGDTHSTQSGSYVSGTYRFGPGAFAQQSAARAAEPEDVYRGFGYGVRSTVQPAYAQPQPAYTQTRPAQTPAEPVKQQKRHGGLIALALVLTLIVGGVFGALGYKLLAKPDAPAEPTDKTARPSLSPTPAPTRGSGDITERIQRGDGENYAAPAQIYSQNVDAVVGISNESTTTNIWGQASSLASSGTGFIISEDGYILTNYHVAKGADKLTVTLSSGERYAAELIGYDNVTCDVALLKIEAQGLPSVKLGDSDALQVGEQVCTIGNPLGELTYTLTVGYISAKERAINTDGNPINMLQTDAAINSGNSGGPLFDMSGNVVGIVTAKYSGSSSSGATVEGIGFAIPISNVVSILDDLQQYGYVTNRAYLGIQAADTAELTSANLPAGAYVSSVMPGSCAERAGLQAGDVIVGLGDRVINSFEALLTALNRCRAGETSEITFFRDGSYLKAEVTFDQRPQEEQPAAQETQPTESPYSFDFSNPFGFWFP